MKESEPQMPPFLTAIAMSLVVACVAVAITIRHIPPFHEPTAITFGASGHQGAFPDATPVSQSANR